MKKEADHEFHLGSSTTTLQRLLFSSASTSVRDAPRLTGLYDLIFHKLVPSKTATGTPSFNTSTPLDRDEYVVPNMPSTIPTRLCITSNSVTSLKTINIDGFDDDDTLSCRTVPRSVTISTSSTPSLASDTSSPPRTASPCGPRTPPKRHVPSTSIDRLVFGHSPIAVSKSSGTGMSFACVLDPGLSVGSTIHLPSANPSSRVHARAHRISNDNNSKGPLHSKLDDCYRLDSVPWSDSSLLTGFISDTIITLRRPNMSPSTSTTLRDLEARVDTPFTAPT